MSEKVKTRSEKPSLARKCKLEQKEPPEKRSQSEHHSLPVVRRRRWMSVEDHHSERSDELDSKAVKQVTPLKYALPSFMVKFNEESPSQDQSETGSNSISPKIFYSKKRRLLLRDSERHGKKSMKTSRAQSGQKMVASCKENTKTRTDVCMSIKQRLLQRSTRSCKQESHSDGASLKETRQGEKSCIPDEDKTISSQPEESQVVSPRSRKDRLLQMNKERYDEKNVESQGKCQSKEQNRHLIASHSKKSRQIKSTPELEKVTKSEMKACTSTADDNQQKMQNASEKGKSRRDDGQNQKDDGQSRNEDTDESVEIKVRRRMREHRSPCGEKKEPREKYRSPPCSAKKLKIASQATKGDALFRKNDTGSSSVAAKAEKKIITVCPRTGVFETESSRRFGPASKAIITKLAIISRAGRRSQGPPVLTPVRTGNSSTRSSIASKEESPEVLIISEEEGDADSSVQIKKSKKRSLQIQQQESKPSSKVHDVEKKSVQDERSHDSGTSRQPENLKCAVESGSCLKVQAISRRSVSTSVIGSKRSAESTNSESNLKRRKLGSTYPATIVVRIGKDGHISPTSYERLVDSMGQKLQVRDAKKSSSQNSSMDNKRDCKESHESKTDSRNAARVHSCTEHNKPVKESSSTQLKQAKENPSDKQSGVGSTVQQQHSGFPGGPVFLPAAGTTNPQECANYPVIIIKPDSEKGPKDSKKTDIIDNEGKHTEDADICNVREILMQRNVGGRNVIRHVLLPISTTKVNSKTSVPEKPPVEVVMPKAVHEVGPAMEESVPAAETVPGAEKGEMEEAESKTDQEDQEMPEPSQANTSQTAVQLENQQIQATQAVILQEPERTENQHGPTSLQTSEMMPSILQSFPPFLPIPDPSPQSTNPLPVPNPNLPENYLIPNINPTVPHPSIIRDICDVEPEVAEEYHGGIFLFGAQPIRAHKRITVKTKEKPRNLQEVICMYIDALIDENQELLQITQSDFPVIPINWDREVYAQAALQKPTEFPSKKLQIFLEQFNIELQVFPHNEPGQANINNNATSTILHDARPWMSDDILSLTSESIVEKYEAKIREIAAKSKRTITKRKPSVTLYDDDFWREITRAGALQELDPGNLIASQSEKGTQADFQEHLNELEEVNTAVSALLHEEYPQNVIRPIPQAPSPPLPDFVQVADSLNSERIALSAPGVQASSYQPAQSNPIQMNMGMPEHSRPDFNRAPDRNQYLEMLEANAPGDESDSADEEMRSMSAAITLTSFGMDSRLNRDNSMSDNARSYGSADSQSNVFNNDGRSNVFNNDSRRNVFNNDLQRRIGNDRPNCLLPNDGSRADLEQDSHSMDLPEEPVPSHLQKRKSSDHATSTAFDLSDDSVDQEVMNTLQFDNLNKPPHKDYQQQAVSASDEAVKENKDPRMDRSQRIDDKWRTRDGNVNDNSFRPLSNFSNQQLSSDSTDLPLMDSNKPVSFLEMLWQQNEKSLDPRLAHLPYPSHDSFMQQKTSYEAFQPSSQEMCSDPRLMRPVQQPSFADAHYHVPVAHNSVHSSQSDIMGKQQASAESEMNSTMPDQSRCQPAAPTDPESMSTAQMMSAGLQMVLNPPSLDEGPIPWYHCTPEKVRNLEDHGSPLTPESTGLTSVRDLIDVQYKQVYMQDIDADTEDSNQDPRSTCKELATVHADLGSVEHDTVPANATELESNDTTLLNDDTTPQSDATQPKDDTTPQNDDSAPLNDSTSQNDVNLAESDAILGVMAGSGTGEEAVEKIDAVGDKEAPESTKNFRENVEDPPQEETTSDGTCSSYVSDKTQLSPVDVTEPTGCHVNVATEWPACSQYDASVNQFHGHLQTSVPDEIFDDPSSETQD